MMQKMTNLLSMTVDQSHTESDDRSSEEYESDEGVQIDDIKKKQQDLRKLQDHLNQEKVFISEINGRAGKIIHLDVGGYKFTTTLTTLTLDPDSMLASMFSGRFILEKCLDGYHFLDRDGRYFHHILNFLRTGNAPIISNVDERESVIEEAKYYGLSLLVHFLQTQRETRDDLSVSRWTQKELIMLVNSSVNGRKIQLSATNLSGLRLDGMILPEANLRHAILSGASLKHADFSKSHFEHADMRDSDLQFINLEGANLQYANLQGVNLQNASLVGADLRNADLQNAGLQNANLEGCNLQNAILKGADLQYTNLVNAKLQGAHLYGVNNVHCARGIRR